MQGKISVQRLFFLSFGMLLACYLNVHFRSPAQVEAQDNQPIYLPLIANNYDPSWQWSTAITVELTPLPQHTPLLTLDLSGRLHIFWDTQHSPRFIYHTYLGDQGWTTPAPIAQTLGILKWTPMSKQ